MQPAQSHTCICGHHIALAFECDVTCGMVLAQSQQKGWHYPLHQFLREKILHYIHGIRRSLHSLSNNNGLCWTESTAQAMLSIAWSSHSQSPLEWCRFRHLQCIICHTLAFAQSTVQPILSVDQYILLSADQFVRIQCLLEYHNRGSIGEDHGLVDMNKISINICIGIAARDPQLSIILSATELYDQNYRIKLKLDNSDWPGHRLSLINDWYSWMSPGAASYWIPTDGRQHHGI